jgi:hypothetical protein
MRSWLLLGLGLCGPLATSCDRGTPTDLEIDRVIDVIAVVSGDSQFGRTGEALADSIVVQVLDDKGVPIESAGVVFTITSGGGALSNDSVEADSDGLARTSWTLGVGPEHRLKVAAAHARSVADPVTVTATNELALQIAVLSGADQVAYRGEALGEPVVVRLLDCYGEAVPGVVVGFEVIRGGGSVAESPVTSAGLGTAETSWSVGKGPDNQLQVSVLSDSLTATPLVVTARTELELTFGWTADLQFHGGQGHDNRILESNHFLIFSDADSDSAKMIMARHTERYLAELLQDFEVDTAVAIGIEPSNRMSKITVYSMRDLSRGQTAFPYGFFHAGFDSAPYLEWGIHNERFFNSIKHETVHVVNLLMNGIGWQPMWFTEGFAEYASGGGEPKFETWDQVVEWKTLARHINPIAIRRYPQDLPEPDSWGEYYPMFHLAVELLLSEDGLGRSYVDVKNMWAALADGVAFDTAFRTHMNITQDDFEASFYSRLEAYLTR